MGVTLKLKLIKDENDANLLNEFVFPTNSQGAGLKDPIDQRSKGDNYYKEFSIDLRGDHRAEKVRGQARLADWAGKISSF